MARELLIIKMSERILKNQWKALYEIEVSKAVIFFNFFEIIFYNDVNLPKTLIKLCTISKQNYAKQRRLV